jgi:hypothetical protein
MTTIGAHYVPDQLAKANAAIAAATGRTPVLWRPAGGLTNDAVNQQAAKHGLAGILWDVIPFDWINDSDTAATRHMLMTQIKPGSVVLLHDTYSSTVDLVQQFIPVLKANGYHLVTVSELLGQPAVHRMVRPARHRHRGAGPAGGRPGRYRARRRDRHHRRGHRHAQPGVAQRHGRAGNPPAGVSARARAGAVAPAATLSARSTPTCRL